MKKILIVRFSSIGDIVLTTPVVRCLKKQYPNCELHYLTKHKFSGLLKHNPYIDKTYTIEKDVNEIVKQLKQENYDFIIDLHKNLRTQKLRFLLGKKSYQFSKLNIKKWLLTTFKINKMPNIHIVDRYFETVNFLNVKNDNKGLDYFIPNQDKINIKEYYIPTQFVVYAIGGQFATKRMPVKKIIELIQSTEQTIVLLGGVTDLKNAKLITEACNNVINLCGDLNLNQSASILKQAQKVITHDTGLMHIASAFNKTIISIWGNTVPSLGMYPYMPQNNSHYSLHQVNNLKCRPCSKIGYQTCPKKHFNCMNQQNLKAITSELEK